MHDLITDGSVMDRPFVQSLVKGKISLCWRGWGKALGEEGQGSEGINRWGSHLSLCPCSDVIFVDH